MHSKKIVLDGVYEYVKSSKDLETQFIEALSTTRYNPQDNERAVQMNCTMKSAI